jgi:hypothetical protein
VEVLIATGVISVALYGLVLVMGAQELAEARQREARVVRHLHSQLIREIVKGERSPQSSWNNNIELYNPAVGRNTPIYYRDNINGAVLKTQLEWRGSASSNRTNDITVLYPFNSNTYSP